MTIQDTQPISVPAGQVLVTYCILMHSPAGDINKGRTIGVIATDGTSAWFWGLDRDGNPYEAADIRTIFSELAKENRQNEWVYDEWAAWLRDFLENEARDSDLFQKYVKKLPASGYLFAVPGWSLPVPEGVSSKKVIEDLVKKSVPFDG